MADGRTRALDDHRSDRKKPGVLIYFLGTDDEQYIKAGKTNQSVNARAKQHAGHWLAGNRPLHFLAGIRGLDSDEKALFRAFPDDVVETIDNTQEWLHARPHIVGYVRWLLQQSFVSDDEIMANAADLTVTSESWLPMVGRNVEAPARLSFGPWESVRRPAATGDDFYTDEEIVKAARAVLGTIDLDPASHPVANRVVRASRIYTVDTDGLSHPWAGRVWLNPPFGNWETWAPKIATEWTSGRVTEMCVLLATRSLTAQCVARLMENKAAICIFRGRIPFWGPKATQSPDDGHAVLYFGRQPELFAAEFSRLGDVSLTWRPAS